MKVLAARALALVLFGILVWFQAEADDAVSPLKGIKRMTVYASVTCEEPKLAANFPPEHVENMTRLAIDLLADRLKKAGIQVLGTEEFGKVYPSDVGCARLSLDIGPLIPDDIICYVTDLTLIRYLSTELDATQKTFVVCTHQLRVGAASAEIFGSNVEYSFDKSIQDFVRHYELERK